MITLIFAIHVCVYCCRWQLRILRVRICMFGNLFNKSLVRVSADGVLLSSYTWLRCPSYITRLGVLV